MDKLKDVGTPHSGKKSKKDKKDKSLLEKESSDEDSISQTSAKMAPVKSAKKTLFRFGRYLTFGFSVKKGSP